MEDNESCLIVVLREEIALALTPQCPSEFFVFENIHYKDLGYDDFVGFYDWLRNTDKRIIGVRCYPWEEFSFPYATVRVLPYVEIDSEEKSVCLFFSDERSFEESLSDDQDFGNNRMYKSDTEEYAISFDADRVMDSFSAEVQRKCRLTNV